MMRGNLLASMDQINCTEADGASSMCDAAATVRDEQDLLPDSRVNFQTRPQPIVTRSSLDQGLKTAAWGSNRAKNCPEDDEG